MQTDNQKDLPSLISIQTKLQSCVFKHGITEV